MNFKGEIRNWHRKYDDYKEVTYKSELPFFVTEYFDEMDSRPDEFCEEQWACRDLVIDSFVNDDLWIDIERANHYFALDKYLGFNAMPWEKFALGLHLCVYWNDKIHPRWPDLFVMMGRGNGKDGAISLESLCLVSPYNTSCKQADVDICANSKEQSNRPVLDIYNALEGNRKKMMKFFKWTKEGILGVKNGGYIRGRADNSKNRDGMRSAEIVFNEYHQYENTKNINVFKSGLGKKEESRTSIFTTNGYVVDGPLDDMLQKCENILFKGGQSNGLLPLIYKLDDAKEVDDEKMWNKANPSLHYPPFNVSLYDELKKQYIDWKDNKSAFPDFMTKRMNIRESDMEFAITSWDNLLATNQDIPDVTGWECIVGIDYSKTTDWVGINCHFKHGDDRYDINHGWVCMQSPKLSKIKAPFREWASEGMLTLVDAPEISPELITEYIKKEIEPKYIIKEIVLDNYRYTLMRDYLERIGYSYNDKTIRLERPSDIMRTYPLIDRCFQNHFFHWGDSPVLRWSANNCKLIRAKKSVLAENGESDMGNYLIGKIEPDSRKTDCFMALVACMCYESDLTDMKILENREYIPVFTF